MKKRLIVFSVAVALVSIETHAQCGQNSKTIFSCLTEKGKQIELCDAGKTIEYSFGKPQEKPEIVLQVPRTQASTFQWKGVGREESYAVDIPNGKTTYNIFWGVDRLVASHPVDAGVNVMIDGALAATIHCVSKSIVNHLRGVQLKPTE